MMPSKIGLRLFLTMLAATGAVVLAMMILMQWSFERGFGAYVEAQEAARMEPIAERLEEYYRREGDWEGLRGDARNWGRLLRPRRFAAREHGMHGTMHRRAPELPALRSPASGQAPPFLLRLMLLDPDHRPVLGRPHSQADLILRPLHPLGEPASGYLALIKPRQPSEQIDLQFAREQWRGLLLVGLGVALLSALLALPLAQRLVRPIRRLRAHSLQLAAGDYRARSPVQGRDELAGLAEDFNSLATALERNEGLRREWMADVSHELRTPLSVLRAEVEALQDGLRQPDADTLKSLAGDVRHLSRLVDDLYQLSMSDLGSLSYHKRDTELLAVLADAMEAARPGFVAAGLELELVTQGLAGVTVLGDADRLAQLFNNLLNNSLRYTSAPGRLRVSGRALEGRLELDFEDSAPGLTEDALQHVFDRFYRAEASRSRRHGGAGLGLSIARNIVEAHAGHISAHLGNVGGLRLHIELPMQGTTGA